VVRLTAHRLVDQPPAGASQGDPERRADALPACAVASDLGVFRPHFVGPDDHWLPPDNYQEYRDAAVAHRTSPTNIGLALLANLSAYDFGYLVAGQVLERTANTLNTMDGLERHRGHFYNWYDTQTLQPLPPLYISTVDSGNLAGHLLTLRAGLLALADDRILPAQLFDGLGDTLDILRGAARSCRGAGDGIPEPTGIRLGCPSMEYDFLYDDTRRHLACAGELLRSATTSTSAGVDASYYDLLASEARLCSFVAIAQGNCRRRAGSPWAACSPTHGRRAGSPVLERIDVRVPDAAAGDADLRQHAARSDLPGSGRRQIEYGRQRGVPWGISESGYNMVDAQLNYQYRAFGVPGLGLKRGLAEDLVIAPYASALALMVAPEEACLNLQRLAAEGAMGRYGLYEAIDYTPARLPPRRNRSVSFAPSWRITRG
jgi:cyclic beta-1,2-glucan synthetase